MVKILAHAGINVFVLLNTFVEDQIEEMEKPRVKFHSFLGSLVPDNSAAGYLLARTLFDKARQEGHGATGGKIEVIAINGDFVTPAAIARNVGMHLAVAETEGIDLRQVFVGQWNREKAYLQAQGALFRYPELSVIWAANDPMALGALDAVREAGKISGKDIMIGGVNWDLPALLEIRDGGMVASAGGHFMAGAWALVLLYDYFHGRDFADIGTELQLPLFSLLDRQGVVRYLAVFGDGDWTKIDFRKFSRILNPDQQRYDFSMEKVYQNIVQ
jgi:ABC-type sugar transport system substrate-binding protein